MIAYALLVLAQSQAPMPAATASPSEQVGQPPIKFILEGVSAERTIAEFMNVCFRPRWNVEDVRKAVDDSDFDYKEQTDDQNSGSYRWKAPRAYLALEDTNPQMLSQCALSIGSIQARSGDQMLAMLKPAVEAELGHTVSEDDTHFRLEWTEPDTGDLDRIELAGASSDPSQAIWYVFDKTPPGVREKLDALFQQ